MVGEFFPFKPLVETFQIRKGKLTDRAGNLEENQQYGPLSQRLFERERPASYHAA